MFPERQSFAFQKRIQAIPIPHLKIRLSICLLLLEPLTACVSAAQGVASPAPLPILLPTNSPSALLPKSVIASCPVTLPNSKSPTASSASDFNYGNEDGTLFTIPWPEGVVIFARDGPGFIEPDGSLAMKWPWWRGVRGKLTIEGRRLDAPAPPLRAEITEGYGNSGFQPISLIFPTQGCWEVTGKVDNAQLTFVTLVVQVPFRIIGFNWLPEGGASGYLDISELPESLRDVSNFSNGGELITDSAVDERAIITPDPNATQQKVTVWGQPGICVQGALVNQQWQDNADAGFLQWTEGGTSYRISHKGLGLQCDDLQSLIYAPP